MDEHCKNLYFDSMYCSEKVVLETVAFGFRTLQISVSNVRKVVLINYRQLTSRLSSDVLICSTSEEGLVVNRFEERFGGCN